MKNKISKTTLLIAIGISLLFMMISQVSHSVYVYNLIAQGESIIYAYFFSIAFDISVAIFIIMGKKTWAYISASFMLIINLIYYSNPLSLPHVVMLIIAAITISTIMAGIISAYSIIFHEESEEVVLEPNPLEQTVEELKSELERFNKPKRVYNRKKINEQ